MLGTTVTGSGKHAGDSSDVPRMPWDWSAAAHVHAVAAWVVCALAVAMWFALRAVDAPAGPRARARDLLIVLLAQGGIGYVQYFNDVPEILVGLHMLGSSLVWIAVLRLLLSLRERPAAGAAAVPRAAAAGDPAGARGRALNGYRCAEDGAPEPRPATFRVAGRGARSSRQRPRALRPAGRQARS